LRECDIAFLRRYTVVITRLAEEDFDVMDDLSRKGRGQDLLRMRRGSSGSTEEGNFGNRLIYPISNSSDEVESSLFLSH
jgi:hypothetical protein